MNALRRALPQKLGTVHYVAAAVLLLRLVVLVQLAGSPAFLPTGGDTQFYDEWAQRITRGEWTDGRAFYGLPLYPYLLAFCYGIAGTNPFLPVLLQVLCDTATAVLLFKLALRTFAGGEGIFRHRASVTGIAAAAGWALFVPAQVYSVVLMPTALVTFAFWWVAWRLVRRDNAPPPGEALLLGLVIGVSAMAVATILFLLPLVLAAILLKNARTAPPAAFLRGATAAFLLLLAGVALGTSPAWLHNTLIARDPVLLSAHSGVNFWIGNNPDAAGYPTFPSGLRAGQAAMLRDSVAIAEGAAGKPLKRSEVAQFWSAQARNYIAAEPGAWLRLLAQKLHNFWNAFEYDDVHVIAKLREEGVLLPGPTFGLIAALALPGILLSVPRFRAARWIAAAILLHMLAVLPVFVTERYRLAAAPGLILFATAGLWLLWEAVARQHWTRGTIYVLLLLAGTWWISTPPARPELWALEHYHAGLRALERQDLTRANGQLQLARSYSPGNVEVQFALGNVALAAGDVAQARQYYLATVAGDPRHAGALNNLGVIALEEGSFAAAADYFGRALREEPASAKAHYLLARALLGMGNRAGARRHLDRAIELQPEQPEFRALRMELDGAP